MSILDRSEAEGPRGRGLAVILVSASYAVVLWATFSRLGRTPFLFAEPSYRGQVVSNLILIALGLGAVYFVHVRACRELESGLEKLFASWKNGVKERDESSVLFGLSSNLACLRRFLSRPAFLGLLTVSGAAWILALWVYALRPDWAVLSFVGSASGTFLPLAVGWTILTIWLTLVSSQLLSAIKTETEVLRVLRKLANYQADSTPAVFSPWQEHTLTLRANPFAVLSWVLFALALGLTLYFHVTINKQSGGLAGLAEGFSFDFYALMVALLLWGMVGLRVLVNLLVKPELVKYVGILLAAPGHQMTNGRIQNGTQGRA